MKDRNPEFSSTSEFNKFSKNLECNMEKNHSVSLAMEKFTPIRLSPKGQEPHIFPLQLTQELTDHLNRKAGSSEVERCVVENTWLP